MNDKIVCVNDVYTKTYLEKRIGGSRNKFPLIVSVEKMEISELEDRLLTMRSNLK